MYFDFPDEQSLQPRSEECSIYREIDSNYRSLMMSILSSQLGDPGSSAVTADIKFLCVFFFNGK